MKKIVPQSIKNIYHIFQAVLANFWYGFPSRRLRVIGVTGTNGKTTTVQMIARILEEAEKKIALASTINFKIAEKEWVNKTKFTTLSAFAVQKFIKQAAEAGCEYLILETSSHSLDQYRIWGVKYDVAVMTNVTREHLDYHKTMERYRKAKKILFKNAADNKGVIIVNLDMENPEEFLNFNADKKFGYTVKMKNGKFPVANVKIIKAEDVELGIDYSKFKISVSSMDGKNSKFRLNLPGEFNVENALAAACVGISENIDLETASKALEKIKNVPGRLEFVPNDKNLNIIVDYAVTPDSLEKLYELMGELNTGKSKVIAVFGSCGDRDRGKRPMMGEIVSKNADFLIVTNEDPYSEDPMQIINEVAAGIKNKKEGEIFWKILDRREAIQKALKLANTGDFVVVTGKGAEETMAIGKKRIPWNDRKVIEEELGKL